GFNAAVRTRGGLAFRVGELAAVEGLHSGGDYLRPGFLRVRDSLIDDLLNCLVLTTFSDGGGGNQFGFRLHNLSGALIKGNLQVSQVVGVGAGGNSGELVAISAIDHGEFVG